MKKDRQTNEAAYHLERFPPIRPRLVPGSETVTPTIATRIPISALTMASTSSVKIPISAINRTSSPGLKKSAGSSSRASDVVTSTRGAGAPPLSAVSSQVPVMVVSPMQHKKSSVEPVTLSTQSISTCAPSNTQTATSTETTSGYNRLQLIAPRQLGNIEVPGSVQNSGIVLGNSLPANFLAGSFMPNQLIQANPFLSNILVTPSVQGGAVQGNFAQRFAISGGYIPLNQFQFGIQNQPQFSSCLQTLPGSISQIPLPTICTDSGNTVKDMPAVQEKSATVPALDQSSFQFVIEPDPAFDQKLKGATISKDVVIVSESIPISDIASVAIKESKKMSDLETYEEFSPKIENCYSMKKLSLKEMLDLLDKGINVMTFVKPGTNDYYRARVLCEAVVKHHITNIESDIKDDFYTSLVSPYISLNDAFYLKNEMKMAVKRKQKQRKSEGVHISENLTRSPDVDEIPSGMETAASILKWRTEKLENIDPVLFRQFCCGDENQTNENSLPRNKDRTVINEENMTDDKQKHKETIVSHSETDIMKRTEKDKVKKFKQKNEDLNEMTGNSKSHSDLMHESDDLSKDEQALIKKVFIIKDQCGKESEADLLRKAFYKEPCKENGGKTNAALTREEFSGSPGYQQRNVITHSEKDGNISSGKTNEPDAELANQPQSKQTVEQNQSENEAELIRKLYDVQRNVSKQNESECMKDVCSPQKTKPKEIESEAELIRKAFTLSKFKFTQTSQSSACRLPVAKTSIHSDSKYLKNRENSSQDQSDLTSVSEEIVVIKSEPYEDMLSSDVEISSEQEKNCKHTEIAEDCNTESYLNKTRNRNYSVSSEEINYSVSSEEILSDFQTVQNNEGFASDSLQPSFDKSQKSPGFHILLRKTQNLKNGKGKRALLSDSDGDTTDVTAAGSPAPDVVEVTDAIQLPNEFIFRKWNLGTLENLQKLSGKVSCNSCCYLCGLLFSDPKMAWTHIINEHAKLKELFIEFPNYICTHCYHVFDTFTLVQQHEVEVHLCEFPCYFCGLSIDDSSTMLVHVAQVHSRLYKCGICEGQFLGKWEFDKHCTSEVHMQSKQDVSKRIFQCLFCNCKFDSEMTLASHLISSHIGKPLPNSGECVCQACRHSFLDAQALLNHRSSDARVVEKSRPLSTVSLVELAVQVIKSKEVFDNLKPSKQRRSGTSHGRLDDVIKKIVSGSKGVDRELIIGEKKYMYPFVDLLRYCELGSGVPAKSTVLIMDELIKFLINSYPLMQIDTTNTDLHYLVVAVSRSQKFTLLLRTLHLKPLPWTGTIQKRVKIFLKKAQSGCYRNTNLTALCESLQKSLNFFEDKQNPAKQILPASAEGNTVKQVQLPLQDNVTKNSDLSLPGNAGIAGIAAQALKSPIQPCSLETAGIAIGRSGIASNPNTLSNSTISTSASDAFQSLKSSTSAQIGNATIQTAAGTYKIVQIGMNNVILLADQSLNPNDLTSQTVVGKGVTVQKLQAFGSDVSMNKGANYTNSASTLISLPQSFGQSVLKVQSERQSCPHTHAHRNQNIAACSSQSKSRAAGSTEVKKLIPIAPKGVVMSNCTFESVKKKYKCKNKESNIDSDVQDVPEKELTDLDSLVARSNKLKRWFLRAKKPIIMKRHTVMKRRLPAIPPKVCTHLNEKVDKTVQESRKLVVNNRLKTFLSKKTGFHVADKYRAQTKRAVKEILPKGRKANCEKKVKIKTDSSRKTSELMQSCGQVLRKRKPVKYTFEEDALVESDEESVVLSSVNNTESEEEWQPSDIESEEFSDGITSNNDGDTSDEEDFSVSNHTVEEIASTKAKANTYNMKNKSKIVDFEKQSRNVQYTRKDKNLDSVIGNQEGFWENIPIQTECDFKKQNSVKDLTAVVKQEQVSQKSFSEEKLQAINSTSSKDLMVYRKKNEKLLDIQRVCLKRYAPSLLKQSVPTKILKVANSVESLHCCTMKMPWLNTILKCSYVKIERNDQANRLASGIEHYTERRFTRNFVKEICKEDQSRERSEVQALKSTLYNNKEDMSMKMDINSASDGKRKRGRPKKSVNEAGVSFITERDIPEKETKEVIEDNDTSVFVGRKKLRPRRKFNYFEEDSSDASLLVKNSSDDSQPDAVQKESAVNEDQKLKKQKHEIGISRSHASNSKLGTVLHAKPRHIFVTNKKDGDISFSKDTLVNSVSDETDNFVSREKRRMLNGKCIKVEDPNQNDRTMGVRSYHESNSKLDGCMSPKPNLINVTDSEDVDLSVGKDVFDETDREDCINDETRTTLRNTFVKIKNVHSQIELNASRDENISISERGETDLTILPLSIKQEIDDLDQFKGSASVTVLVPPQQKNTSGVVTSVSQTFQNSSVQVLQTSVKFAKEADTEKLMSSQFSPSRQTISVLSPVSNSPLLVTQASSKLITTSSSSVMKQLHDATHQDTRKPNILIRKKSSTQAVSSEPKLQTLQTSTQAMQIARYPVLLYPHGKPNAMSSLSTASTSTGSTLLRGPPPLVQMSTTNSSQNNAQSAMLQTQKLEVPTNQPINLQMHSNEITKFYSNELSKLVNTTQKFGLNQTQMQQVPVSQQTPVTSSPVYFVPVSGTNHFIQVNILGGLNSVAQAGQLQQAGQTQQTNQFQQTGQMQTAQMIHEVPRIGPVQPQLGQVQPHIGQVQPQIGQVQPHIGQVQPQIGQVQPHIGQVQPQLGQVQLSNFPALTHSLAQPPALQQCQQQQITNSQINNQCNNPAVKSSLLQGPVIKQEVDSDEHLGTATQSTNHSEVIQQQSTVIPKHCMNQNLVLHQGTSQQAVTQQQNANQNAFLQQIPLVQPVGQMPGMLSNRLPLIQTGQLQVPGLQPVVGMMSNQLQALNQSGQIVQFGHIGQTQQQSLSVIGVQGSSQTLMVNQQTPLAPGQLIYVANSSGTSDAVQTGSILSTSQIGNNALQSVPVLNALKTTMTASIQPQTGQVLNPGQIGQLADGQQTGVRLTEHTDGQKEQPVEEDATGLDDTGADSPASKKCKKCFRNFEDEDVFTTHLSMHLDGKYQCAPCKLHFQDKFDCSLHKALLHSKSFNCNLCNKSSATQVKMVNHMRELHELLPCDAEKNAWVGFSCHMCHVIFREERKLRIHLKCHFGGFFCEVCAQQFNNKKPLEIHYIKKHGKCYVCNVCNEKFFFENDINHHISLHNHKLPLSSAKSELQYSLFYTCNQCDKRFEVDGGEDSAFFHDEYEHTYK